MPKQSNTCLLKRTNQVARLLPSHWHQYHWSSIGLRKTCIITILGDTWCFLMRWSTTFVQIKRYPCFEQAESSPWQELCVLNLLCLSIIFRYITWRPPIKQHYNETWLGFSPKGRIRETFESRRRTAVKRVKIKWISAVIHWFSRNNKIHARGKCHIWCHPPEYILNCKIGINGTFPIVLWVVILCVLATTKITVKTCQRPVSTKANILNLKYSVYKKRNRLLRKEKRNTAGSSAWALEGSWSEYSSYN